MFNPKNYKILLLKKKKKKKKKTDKHIKSVYCLFHINEKSFQIIEKSFSNYWEKFYN
jgi:hypothetical protein